MKKFYAVVGNPPYNEDSETYNRQPPIYPAFYDEVALISEKNELITPARFLFDTGLTNKDWNKKMLSDEHLNVEYYEPDSSKVFPGLSTPIKGGVAVVYRDSNKNFGAIGEFIPDDTLRSIAKKFNKNPETNLPSIMYGGRSDLKFNDIYLKDYPESVGKRLQAVQKKHPKVTELSPNEEYEIKSSTLEVLADCGLHEMKPESGDYYEILGLCNTQRVYRYIERKYMVPRYPERNNINGYKVFIAESNGSGAYGEVLSTPLVGAQFTSSTPTFISIGNFNSEDDAEHLLKYIKTKFVRALLGILKKTQHNPVLTWSYVPLQDFTSNSNIDWSKSIHEIDIQLYRIYGFLPNEIDFIENNVKEMT